MSDCIKVSKSPSIRNIENHSRFCERPEPHQHPGHRSSLLYAAAGGDRERAQWPSSTHSMWKRSAAWVVPVTAASTVQRLHRETRGLL